MLPDETKIFRAISESVFGLTLKNGLRLCDPTKYWKMDLPHGDPSDSLLSHSENQRQAEFLRVIEEAIAKEHRGEYKFNKRTPEQVAKNLFISCWAKSLSRDIVTEFVKDSQVLIIESSVCAIKHLIGEHLPDGLSLRHRCVKYLDLKSQNEVDRKYREALGGLNRSGVPAYIAQCFIKDIDYTRQNEYRFCVDAWGNEHDHGEFFYVAPGNVEWIDKIYAEDVTAARQLTDGLSATFPVSKFANLMDFPFQSVVTAKVLLRGQK